ncbi:hypothetical protein ERO13_D13G060100v2 [Gossypium hirsutum]|uniref:TPD1 protein homolog 1 n=3 Tax=Gossypium TaxID=3633 RepID=A0A1U8KQ74_GOSHI|nr:TPD1 protein homolog 1-like [Gossypium hirsutum]KAB1993954.1 hypothetical protein ES319_D13G067400v1 [Gossypium barbadense]KAG4110634.1 hypothetical protein ERO13_D13G060100v2 [Gossypium hirsutum]PPD87143.1 hypothetical protein GOBAR_DD15932 [Gossypium barbadense]TYH33603.1 hypothetical protein ES332_D13G070300v1 [Gossypium tomentosum]
MATTLTFFFVVLFLALIGQGYCQCTLADVKIIQTQTGKTVENKPEWKATVKNDCTCTQSDLKLSCDGFQTVKAVDSSLMAKTGAECLINGGQPVASSSNLSFNYAWDTSFPFKPLSSQINCS